MARPHLGLQRNVLLTLCHHCRVSSGRPLKFSACFLCSPISMLYASCWLQVPSFDNATAMSLIAQELGQPWHELYADLSPRPIAAASLGQVKLFLLSGRGAVTRNASPVMVHLWPYDYHTWRISCHAASPASGLSC